ncbi:hypothetical protein D3C80_1457570 [compost metagenome]
MRHDLAAGLLGKAVQAEGRFQLLPVASQKVIPYHVERDWRYAPVFCREIVAAGFDLRQAVGQYVDAAVHHNAGHHLGIVLACGVAAHEVGQQIAQ